MFDKLHLMSTTHLIYITIGIAMTIWVARTLRIHGRIFFTKGCKGNDELADSLSHLFSVGFYLLHIGFVLLALKLGGTVMNSAGAIELLSTKIGLVLTVLGLSLFAHIAIFARIHGKPRRPNTTVDPITAEIANS
ncbi:MAG: hypothetical protein GY768_13490 [Planctomycetaceae bacterium]|nr:hypothetical protein [Planctomycetaceae bacterium]